MFYDYAFRYNSTGDKKKKGEDIYAQQLFDD